MAPRSPASYRALLGAADEVGWPYHSARASLVGRNASSANHQLVPRPGDEQDLERTKLGDEQAKCPVAVGFIEVIANSCSARSKLGLGQRMGTEVREASKGLDPAIRTEASLGDGARGGRRSLRAPTLPLVAQFVNRPGVPRPRDWRRIKQRSADFDLMDSDGITIHQLGVNPPKLSSCSARSAFEKTDPAGPEPT